MHSPPAAKTALRKPRQLNDAQAAPFAVFRAIKAGITEPDEIASITKLDLDEVSRIVRARGWRIEATPSTPDLTEEMA